MTAIPVASVGLDVVVLGEGELPLTADLRSLAGITCVRVAWPRSAPGVAALPNADVAIANLNTITVCEASLRRLRQGRPQLPVLALVAPDVADATLREIASLVDDFMLAPAQPRELEIRLARLAAARVEPARAAARRISRELGLRNLVGDAPAFRSLVDGIPRLAASEATVLVTGETGTGKECYARAVHYLSPRRERPFIAIDCGACPDQLFENELFGHTRGAFTDARDEHRGWVAMAEGGVLFLDEIDALSATAQSKLLRFLQERTYKPLGGERVLRADVRVVAATNQNLWQLVKEQRFRADLYYRLGVLPVHIPPLRERRCDIRRLALHFLEQAAAAGGPRRRFTEQALTALAAYDFPGNVRELGNMVQRVLVVVDADSIDEGDLLFMDGGPVHVAHAPATSFRLAKAQAVADFERTMVAELLAKHHGNVTQASREAQQDRRVFGRLVKKYRLGRVS